MRLATIPALIAFSIALGGPAPRAAFDQINPPDQSADIPDGLNTDSNGDGIDGMRLGPVFVDPANGADSNPGTIDAPMRTLNAAMLAARQLTPVRAVYVATGTLTEVPVFQGGVAIYGAYDASAGWATRSTRSLIAGNATIGGWIVDAGAAVKLDSISVLSSNAVQLGGSSLGLYIRNSAVDLLNCAILAGSPRAGMSGGPGFAGTDGTAGTNGTAGDGDGSGQGAPGGIGGGPAELKGGNGGRGGNEGTNAGQRGGDGTGPITASGGLGGGGGSTGSPGATGSNGANGDNGVDGAAGTGLFGASFGGSNGIINGSGGGGGGGGGGQGGPFVVDGYGNGGGGGGGGGTLAGGGVAGQRGGSSIAVLIAESSVVDITGGTLTAQRGGNGGDGGAGGTGGRGGAAGSGGQADTGEIGAGGNGGRGGNGGNGGHGAGGSAGHSILALHPASSTLSAASVGISYGSGGTGGASPGTPGQNGIGSSFVEDQSFFILTLDRTLRGVHATLNTSPGSSAAPATPLVACVDNFGTYQFSVLGQPAHGTAGVSGNQLTYLAQPGFLGTDSFPIRATQFPGAAFVDGYAVVFVRESQNSARDWALYR